MTIFCIFDRPTQIFDPRGLIFRPLGRPKFLEGPFGTLWSAKPRFDWHFLWSLFQAAKKKVVEKPVQKWPFFGVVIPRSGGAAPRPSRILAPQGPRRGKTSHWGRGWRGVFLTWFLRPFEVSNLCSPHNTGQFYHLWEAQIFVSNMVKNDHFWWNLWSQGWQNLSIWSHCVKF